MKSNITIPTFKKFKINDFENSICITNDTIYDLYKSYFNKKKTIIIADGEVVKNTIGVNTIVNELLNLGADKSTTLIGVGGGVITDITGFIANVYMRGMPCVLVPTTLLAMVDASIGGKNGINFNLQKNLMGCISQPKEIIVDTTFLKTLPQQEWQNGFAEIIKHACIKSKILFNELEKNNINFYKRNSNALKKLIEQNIEIKTKIVVKDVNEKGERKLLNFGHTLGHAIETVNNIAHGKAVSIGINFASKLSNQLLHFKEKEKLENLLQQYELPINIEFDRETVFSILKNDKKKNAESIDFILLEKIGKAVIKNIAFKDLKKML